MGWLGSSVVFGVLACGVLACGVLACGNAQSNSGNGAAHGGSAGAQAGASAGSGGHAAGDGNAGSGVSGGGAASSGASSGGSAGVADHATQGGASGNGVNGVAGSDYGGAPNAPEAGGLMATAVCAKLLACCDAASFKRLSVPSSMEGCVSFFLGRLSAQAQELELESGPGHFIYTPELLRACLASIDSLACEDWIPESTPLDYRVNTPTCLALVVPLVNDGGSCRSSADCVSGSCQIPSPTGKGYVCETRGALGEACTPNPPHRCGQGLSCSNGACVTKLPGLPGGAPCTSSQDCRSGICTVQGECAVADCIGK